MYYNINFFYDLKDLNANWNWMQNFSIIIIEIKVIIEKSS